MHRSEFRGAEREYRFSENIRNDNRLKSYPVIVIRLVPNLLIGCAEVGSRQIEFRVVILKTRYRISKSCMWK